MEKLWQFMQVDMEVDKFEEKMRQSENRQKLIRQRNFLMEQQNNMKKLESNVADMQDRLAAVQDEAVRLEKSIRAIAEELRDNPPTTPQETNERMNAVRRIVDTLKRYETEVQKMRKDATEKDRQQKAIRAQAAKTKQEYDALKNIYDQEFKRDTQTLNEMRGKVEAESKKLPSDLLEKYRTIKQHCTPPMAKLINGQCSGCFMSLPSATLMALKGENVVLCDNCGRILYNE